MISKEIILKFKNIYEAKYKVSITNEEATQMANDLVNLIKILLQPDSSENNTQNIERSENETISTFNS